MLALWFALSKLHVPIKGIELIHLIALRIYDSIRGDELEGKRMAWGMYHENDIPLESDFQYAVPKA